jgi:hypothetical protein
MSAFPNRIASGLQQPIRDRNSQLPDPSWRFAIRIVEPRRLERHGCKPNRGFTEQTISETHLRTNNAAEPERRQLHRIERAPLLNPSQTRCNAHVQPGPPDHCPIGFKVHTPEGDGFIGNVIAMTIPTCTQSKLVYGNERDSDKELKANTLPYASERLTHPFDAIRREPGRDTGRAI